MTSAPRPSPFAWPRATLDSPPVVEPLRTPAAPTGPYSSPGSNLQPPDPNEIRVGPNGYIHGVDGMLDQIAGALMRHAGPMLRREVLPAVREDAQLQTRVGAAAGRAVANELAPWVVLGAAALGVMAAIQLGRWSRERQERPSRGER